MKLFARGEYLEMRYGAQRLHEYELVQTLSFGKKATPSTEL
jgi:hypothetical protein